MTYECQKLRDAARDEPCVRCGACDGTVVGAHYTGVRRGAYGGGLGKKVHDFMIAHLCANCHIEMDQFREKTTKWDHSEQFLHLIALTLGRLFERGVIVVKGKGT